MTAGAGLLGVLADLGQTGPFQTDVEPLGAAGTVVDSCHLNFDALTDDTPAP